MIIEKIYKCRSCKDTISIEEKGKPSHLTPADEISETIKTDKCKNCCIPTTNGAVLFVVADLIKYIVLK